MVSAPLTLKFIFSLPRTTRLDELYLFVNESLQIEDKEIHGSEAPIEIIKAQKCEAKAIDAVVVVVAVMPSCHHHRVCQ